MAEVLKRSPNRCPTHPGALLRDVVLPAMPLKKTEFAAALGISRQALYDLLAEKNPVSPLLAVKLGLLFEQSPASWLNMQSAYDLWHAERKVDRTRIKPLKLAG